MSALAGRYSVPSTDSDQTSASTARPRTHAVVALACRARRPRCRARVARRRAQPGRPAPGQRLAARLLLVRRRGAPALPGGRRHRRAGDAGGEVDQRLNCRDRLAGVERGRRRAQVTSLGRAAQGVPQRAHVEGKDAAQRQHRHRSADRRRFEVVVGRELADRVAGRRQQARVAVLEPPFVGERRRFGEVLARDKSVIGDRRRHRLLLRSGGRYGSSRAAATAARSGRRLIALAPARPRRSERATGRSGAE